MGSQPRAAGGGTAGGGAWLAAAAAFLQSERAAWAAQNAMGALFAAIFAVVLDLQFTLACLCAVLFRWVLPTGRHSAMGAAPLPPRYLHPAWRLAPLPHPHSPPPLPAAPQRFLPRAFPGPLHRRSPVWRPGFCWHCAHRRQHWCGPLLPRWPHAAGALAAGHGQAVRPAALPWPTPAHPAC